MRLLMAVLTGTLFFSFVNGAETTNQDKGPSTATLKAVFHVNFADSERQEHAR